MNSERKRTRARVCASLIAGSMSMIVSGAALAKDAQAASGETIAHAGMPPSVPPCIACHGAAREGNAQSAFPRLEGLSSGYLAAQLADFASGARQNAVMAPIARAMPPGARADIANYFASLPVPSASSQSAQQVDVLGKEIALHGNWKNDVPACVSCHGDQGSGVGDAFPALSGQPAAYIKAQLSAWKAGTRAPGPLGLMGDIARRLSNKEADAAASYFASLPATSQHVSQKRAREVAR
jgi:cytochrome c553